MREHQGDVAINFLAIGGYCWGRGLTPNAAKQQWRRAGGSGQPQVWLFAYVMEDGRDNKPSVDAMGCVSWPQGATVRRIDRAPARADRSDKRRPESV